MNDLFFDLDAIVADIVQDYDRDDMMLQAELDMLALDDDEEEREDDEV